MIVSGALSEVAASCKTICLVRAYRGRARSPAGFCSMAERLRCWNRSRCEMRWWRRGEGWRRCMDRRKTNDDKAKKIDIEVRE